VYSQYNKSLCGDGTSAQSKTPNLDGLADAGVTFSNFYTPVAICSPSRAALMTGQDPRRHEIYSALLGVPSEKFLQANDAKFTTLAKVLLAANYNTAIVGKWHLGWDDAVNCAVNNSCNCPNGGCNSWDNGFQYNYVLPLGIGQGHNGFCLYSDSDSPKWRYVNEILDYGAEQNTIVHGGCENVTPTSFSNFSVGKSLTQRLTEKAVAYIKNTLDLDPATNAGDGKKP
jgi:hypothetical protein